jgi:hypothetical protein
MATDPSVLASLEPLFGASLAINLAYLNLNQFRYRDEMAKTAKSKLVNAPDTVHETAWYKDIRSLADQASEEKTPLSLPGFWWCYFYRFFFHFQIDKWISVLLTMLSAGYLFLGVAHSVGLFPTTTDNYTSSEIANELSYATAGLIWPMLMVGIAKFCMGGFQKFVEYQLNDITKTELQTGAKDVDAASAELDAKKAT